MDHRSPRSPFLDNFPFADKLGTDGLVDTCRSARRQFSEDRRFVFAIPIVLLICGFYAFISELKCTESLPSWWQNLR